MPKRSHAHTGRLLIVVSLILAAGLCPAVAEDLGKAEKTESVVAIEAIEKIAVFPVFYQGERGEKIDEATAKSLDETWWQVRDELTQTGRFVVASRDFLQKADAFQPRGALSVGDAVILGRYVEADALMTIVLKGRLLRVSIYQAVDGTPAWIQEVDLHPSVLIREQIAKVSRALVKEFVAGLPYQAVTIQDSLSKQTIFEQGGQRFVRIKTAGAKIAVSDPVQWISVARGSLEPLFQGGARIDVKAEGTVTEVRDQEATVALARVLDVSSVRAGGLVNLPNEQARLVSRAKPKDSAILAAVVALEPEAKQAERRLDESGPVATTLSILSSLAVILLLAF